MNIEFIARITCSCGAILELPAYAAYESYGYDGGSAYMDHDFPPDGWLGGDKESHPWKCPECLKIWQDSNSTNIEELWRTK